MKTLKTVVISVLLAFALIAPITISNNVIAGTSEREFLDIYRVGAICCDDWQSEATGSGACSHHGGVKYWIYYNDETGKYTYKSTGRCD